MRSLSFLVDIKVNYSGHFEFKNAKTEFVIDKDHGGIHMLCGVWSDKITVPFLRELGGKLMGTCEFELWFKRPGKTLTGGRSLVVSEFDIVQLLKGRDQLNVVTLYITKPFRHVSSSSTFIQASPKPSTATVGFSVITTSDNPFEKKPNLRASKKLNPHFAEPHNEVPYSASFQRSWEENPTLSLIPEPTRKSPRKKATTITQQQLPSTSTTKKSHSQSVILQPGCPFTPPSPGRPKKLLTSRQFNRAKNLSKAGKEIRESEVVEAITESLKEKEKNKDTRGGRENTSDSEVGRTGKGKLVSSRSRKGNFEVKKGKGKVEKGKVEKGKVEKRKEKLGRGKSKKKRSRSVVEETDTELTDSELSDTGYLSPVEEGDEDRVDNPDLFEVDEHENVLEAVENSLGALGGKGGSEEPFVWGVDNLEVSLIDEGASDSDELRSLQGSDDEGLSGPSFNPTVDFSKPIVLKQSLCFPTNEVFRKALVQHSIENGYDFFYLHNGSDRITAFCTKRCDCEWNSKRSRLGACNCKAKVKCPFKVHARKVGMGEIFQIKTLKLNHKCGVSNYNRKVTSEYLANKYIEFWRTNIDWKLKHFQDHVFKDLNVHVSYAKCWLARARAKLIIFGNGVDQYARVWDYASAIRKYNTGSTSFVVCDGIERPPVIFRRMYICLEPLKVGFIRGCRPILGVDGCHLKGPYPGMCLVAVGKDGNNNIYPIAWAVVEVENTDSWTWFLELLISDLGKEEGNGLTFMSDRQKGLIEAMSRVVPKANVRYCVRHIWANFKLQFSGQVYKDGFWSAARATTKAEFTAAMEGLKLLSTEAFEYLNSIPERHWSRHAFDTECKSNMLVNNICESFNAVLKDARDKAILTHMEWMRRYVMKRNFEKREGVMKYEGKHMPYAEKYLKWAANEVRFCKVFQAHAVRFEVTYHGEGWGVNLEERTCDCRHWQLSGLPCVHAVACILSQRLLVENYVHAAYSKETYQLAYEPTICPMPSVKQWEKTGLPEPLPPPARRMPGRPSSKKRRKEAGEDKEKRTVKRVKKMNKCGNCGQLGHYKRTCKNPPAPPKQPTQPGGRPLGTSAWSKQRREKAERRKATKEAYAAQFPPQPATTSSQPSQSSVAQSTSTRAPF